MILLFDDARITCTRAYRILFGETIVIEPNEAPAIGGAIWRHLLLLRVLDFTFNVSPGAQASRISARLRGVDCKLTVTGRKEVL